MADPDALSASHAVRRARRSRDAWKCGALYTTSANYEAATGEELPDDAAAPDYPEPESAWDFDFDDQPKIKWRLPRLTALCQPGF